MFNEDVTPDEMARFVTENIPDYQQKWILELINDTEVTDDKLDKVGKRFTGELNENSMVISVGANRQKGTFWYNVKREIYKAVCTNSAEYSKERQFVGGLFENLVSTIAGILIAQFNIAAGIATGLATVGLVGVFKVGKNAWCTTNQELAAQH